MFGCCSCFVGWVELVPLKDCLMWPFVVASVFGRYLVASSAVNPGHDVNALFLIALINLRVAGLKHAA